MEKFHKLIFLDREFDSNDIYKCIFNILCYNIVTNIDSEKKLTIAPGTLSKITDYILNDKIKKSKKSLVYIVILSNKFIQLFTDKTNSDINDEFLCNFKSFSLIIIKYLLSKYKESENNEYFETYNDLFLFIQHFINVFIKKNTRIDYKEFKEIMRKTIIQKKKFAILQTKKSMKFIFTF
jgi:hypothetical protein